MSLINSYSFLFFLRMFLNNPTHLLFQINEDCVVMQKTKQTNQKQTEGIYVVYLFTNKFVENSHPYNICPPIKDMKYLSIYSDIFLLPSFSWLVSALSSHRFGIFLTKFILGILCIGPGLCMGDKMLCFVGLSLKFTPPSQAWLTSQNTIFEEL